MNFVPAHLRRRNRIEWWMTACLATLPPTIMLNPYTIEVSSFRHLLDWKLAPELLAALATIVVIIRGISLWFNGRHKPWTAYGRIFGAFWTGLLWLLMSLSLLQLHVTANRPLSVGFGFWLVFAASEVHTCFRAASDAFTRH